MKYIQNYNQDRISLSLKGMSPIQYRAHYLN
ncbi:IS3 family transposase [Aquimarina gracilis]